MTGQTTRSNRVSIPAAALCSTREVKVASPTASYRGGQQALQMVDRSHGIVTPTTQARRRRLLGEMGIRGFSRWGSEAEFGLPGDEGDATLCAAGHDRRSQGVIFHHRGVHRAVARSRGHAPFPVYL